MNSLFGKRLWAILSICSAIGLLGSCRSLQDSSTTATESTQDLAQTPDPNAIELVPPIECNIGEDCFIMHYVDRDPDPNEELDFGCGRQTYDGHKGTDFSLLDEEAMERGVPVVASAAGTVLRVRDGVLDRRATNEQVEEVEAQGIECGNGMVIDHGNGWETQYCHLLNGSVVVQPGTEVESGEELGLVGLSGKTQFPHVHMTVRYEGEVIDPFVGLDTAPSCNLDRRPLWDRPLDYTPTGLIRAGFSTEQPDFDSLWEGRFSETEFDRDIPALIFWTFSYGVLEGDVQRFRMVDPEGEEFLNQESPIDASNRTWMSFVGRRNNPDRPIVPGTWRGEYVLERDGEVVFSIEREIQVR
ncbi:MAG: M23 family metallopeptidase [Cyanobacteriota bacterium]|nr:M23 family metallopeptidase [Cyanobacteriota bacterium]